MNSCNLSCYIKISVWFCKYNISDAMNANVFVVVGAYCLWEKETNSTSMVMAETVIFT